MEMHRQLSTSKWQEEYACLLNDSDLPSLISSQSDEMFSLNRQMSRMNSEFIENSRPILMEQINMKKIESIQEYEEEEE